MTAAGDVLPLDRTGAVEQIAGVAHMTERGWCPFARQHRGPGREGPFGYPAGERNQNRPLLFLNHRMGGYKRTLDDDRWRRENWVGVTAGIGRDGSTDQYCSIFDAHWGNGISGDVARFDRTNPRLKTLEARGVWIPRPMYSARAHSLDAGGVNVLNAGSIAIEFEDETKDLPFPRAQVAAGIRFQTWCLEELIREGTPMIVDEFMEAGHFQIDAVNRSGCPGAGGSAAMVEFRRAHIVTSAPAQEGADDMRLLWVVDAGLHLVGAFGAKWIVDANVAKELEAAYGKPVAISKMTLLFIREATAG